MMKITSILLKSDIDVSSMTPPQQLEGNETLYHRIILSKCRLCDLEHGFSLWLIMKLDKKVYCTYTLYNPLLN